MGEGEEEGRLKDFLDDFTQLETCYENYLTVAGYYTFAIVQRAFASTFLICLIATRLTGSADRDILNYLWNGGEILAVILIANFGTLLRERVSVAIN